MTRNSLDPKGFLNSVGTFIRNEPQVKELLDASQRGGQGLPWQFNSKESAGMQETWVRSLGGEDPLEKGTATHCSILAWRIPWTEEPGGLQSLGGHEKSDTTEQPTL